MGDVRTEEVKLTVDGSEMPTFLALPEAAGPRPAVLVFEEIFGVNAHIRDVAKRLAREGYVAIAPDYHHRAWPPGTQLAYDDEGMKQGMAVIPKLTGRRHHRRHRRHHRLCLKTRKEANAAKLGAIGFCIGGHVAYLAAATQPIAAAASFYGGGIATFAPGGGHEDRRAHRRHQGKDPVLLRQGRSDDPAGAGGDDPKARSRRTRFATKSSSTTALRTRSSATARARLVPRGAGQGCVGARQAAVQRGARLRRGAVSTTMGPSDTGGDRTAMRAAQRRRFRRAARARTQDGAVCAGDTGG